jgi:AcrR family transcriptional regulator
MQKRSLETRTRILNTSLELFSTIGYEKTGVALICQKGEISKGSFYHHFPSKHSVFVALIERWLADIDAHFREDIANASDVPSGILAMTETFAGLTQLSSSYLPLFLEFWLQSVRDPKIWQQTTAPYQNYVDRFKLIFEKGVIEGSIRAIEPKEASYTLIGLALGLLLQNMMSPDTENWPVVSKNCIGLLISGLQGVPNA